ncbi:tetratricopeptide (TPR) repeat protein [Pelomonas aquatica]|uniref:Tetratricopeptide (TPR) repeat protein n=1 Tax=Pelomonas aquatica TaxID=431058 RepID=A0ABU1ZCT4_9BURK|nr:AAA family ATPase [Pelomonas aquatica]MDR7297486.1 tetratricopeptide (TPR) repeat protein [Pelomonas aquatica]
MLKLLGVPAWQAEGAERPLPTTLPGCLLIHLACAGQWVERGQLAALFWPDAEREQARHHLRVNLHRLRQWLDGIGQGDALLAERQRICLTLPGDLALLEQACLEADGAALLARPAAAWLQGFRSDGLDTFWAWADGHGARLQRRWDDAARRALQRAGSAAWRAPLRALLDDGPAPWQTDDDALCGRAEWLGRVRRETAPALVLLGEAGVGKTSVLKAAFPGAPVLQGREGLAQMPYRPIVELLLPRLDVLRALLRQPERGLAAYRLDLARLLPELAVDEPLPPLDALSARARLLEGLARVLEALGPLLLVDDLQWVDTASLELLALLSHRGRLRWRGAARGEELPADHRQWLARQQDLRCLPLPGLALEAVQLLLGRAGQDAADAPALLAASHGNAFVLGELLRARADGVSVSPRVHELLLRRWQALSAAARGLIGAAAMLARPLPLAVLGHVAAVPDAELLTAARQALEAALLREEPDGALQCRHDLVREAVLAVLPAFEAQSLRQRAALALGARPEGAAEPLAVAALWQAAGETQTALAWLHRGAAQQKLRGRYEEAQALWQRIAAESREPALALQARLSLAECALLHDLPAGRQALQQVLALAGAVADPAQREQIEGQALAGLVDNAVFSGDLAAAAALAERLRPLLPRLPLAERCNACEVLIELAMREPDIPAAWALLGQLRQLAPARPTLLSYEGQIHWFGGQVRAARDAFELLLARHPDYCRGLTIESDLGVMLQALGDLPRAEAMARRSLQSWQGVAHTETLSLLMLGLTLTSAGRYGEARGVLDQALALGRAQGSALFEAEALTRRARLYWQSGCIELAEADLAAAEPLLAGSRDPLRVSHLSWLRGLVREARGLPPDPALAARVRALLPRSQHPLLLIRLARLDGLAGDVAAAARQVAIARDAGLLEPLAEGLLLQASGLPAQEARPLLLEAVELAQRQGFVELLGRADAALASTGR